MSAVSEQTGLWLTDFTGQPAAEPWVQELRDAAFQRFAAAGFPTTHDEEWRFTNAAPIARTKFDHTASEGSPIPDAARPYLGKLADIQANPFVALNSAFLHNVTFIRVPRSSGVQEIQVEHAVTRASHVSPRTLIVVDADAQCRIVESYSGDGPYFTNAVTEIFAGDRAVIDHYKVQRESTAAFHISTLAARLGRSANFSTHSIDLGGALVRNDVVAVLSEGTEATLNGLYILNGSQHVDNHTTIDHAKPHGASHELYKGILDGKSSAVFNGRIIVRKDAQKTDSKQTNKNLVLSDDAVIDTKPELQIWADDVRCTHGATIGQLDAESLFYLQSRGIGKKEARRLLTHAFAQDIIDHIQIPALRDSLETYLSGKFDEH